MQGEDEPSEIYHPRQLKLDNAAVLADSSICSMLIEFETKREHQQAYIMHSFSSFCRLHSGRDNALPSP